MTTFWYLQISNYNWINECDGNQTRNHLVCKQTLNDLAKLASLAKLLSGYELDSRCSNVRYRTCFEQPVSRHLHNYRVLIHFKTRTSHDKHIKV